VLTRLVTFTGPRLFINAAAAQGEVRFEVIDEKGNPLAPFTAEDCIPIANDKTLEAVQWKGASDLSALHGKPVRFRFVMKNARPYAFCVSPDASGASRGYVAAGGPGFTGPTDTAGEKFAPG
jgi:hypothetical protein